MREDETVRIASNKKGWWAAIDAAEVDSGIFMNGKYALPFLKKDSSLSASRILMFVSPLARDGPSDSLVGVEVESDGQSWCDCS